jgi:MFS family permease
MVRKVTLPVYRHFGDYIKAFHAFSHNARTYLIFAFLQTMGASMIGTVFALYMRASGMRESSFGLVEGAIALATAAVALIGPALVASLGYRALMLVALGTLVVSRLAQSMLPMAGALIALGVAVGLGDGFLRTVNSAFLSEHSTHEERTQLFSMEFLLRMLGVFAGGIMGGLLPGFVGGEAVVGYQWTMVLGAVVIGVGMIPMTRIDEKIHGVRGFWRVSLQTGREFAAWSHLARLAVPQSFLVFAGAMTAPFIPLYLKETLGATVQQIGLIQGSGALVVGLAAFATPLIRRRLGVGRGVTLLQVLAIPFLMLVPYVGGLLTGVLLLFTRSTLMGAGAPLYSELSMESVRAQDKPLVGGGLLFVLSVVTFAGNTIGGRLMEISYTAPYLPAALVYALGTAVTWVIWVYMPRRKEARATQPALQPAHEAA